MPNDAFSDVLGLPTIWVPHSYPPAASTARTNICWPRSPVRPWPSWPACSGTWASRARPLWQNARRPRPADRRAGRFLPYTIPRFIGVLMSTPAAAPVRVPSCSPVRTCRPSAPAIRTPRGVALRFRRAGQARDVERADPRQRTVRRLGAQGRAGRRPASASGQPDAGLLQPGRLRPLRPVQLRPRALRGRRHEPRLERGQAVRAEQPGTPRAQIRPGWNAATGCWTSTR